MARTREITSEKLDSLMKAAEKMGNSIRKACNSQHKNYVSVMVAAKTLNHPLRGLVRAYKARETAV